MAKKLEIICVIGLLSVFLLLSLYLAATDSQTIDEGPHISAGYSYFLTGDFRMNPEHPPLFKLLAAIPLLFYGPDLPTDHQSWANYNQWDFGRQFLYYNTKPADTIIFLARLFPIFLGIALGYFIYKWAKELFGLRSGLFALFLYALSPEFLGHSHLVTTDVPVTFFFLLSIYYFGRYLKKPVKKILIAAAVVFALAILTKYSAIILAPILTGLYIINGLKKKAGVKSALKKYLKIFVIFFGFTSGLTLIFYGFEFQKPLNDPRVQKLYEERLEIIEKKEINQYPPYIRFMVNFTDPETLTGDLIQVTAKNIPIPAYSYWRGFFSVLSHNETGHGSVLFEKYRLTGWWYYFIIAFLVKTPLTVLISFLAVVIICLLKKNRDRDISEKTTAWQKLLNIKFDFWLITFPPVIYFLWSMTSHINLGVRHIFPVYPFLYIGISYLASLFFKSWRAKKIYFIAAIFLAIFYVATNLMVFPFYLSYFNEAVGGASQGHKYLTDSNLDWGQDIKRLKIYLEKNNIKQFHSLIFGSLVTNYYLKGEMNMPDDSWVEKYGANKGYYIISANPLFDPTWTFKWLKKYTPIAIIGYSIYVYKL